MAQRPLFDLSPDQIAGVDDKGLRLLIDGSKVKPIRPSIRDLSAASGAYVVVSSKGSTTEKAMTARRAAVADLPGRTGWRVGMVMGVLLSTLYTRLQGDRYIR